MSYGSGMILRLEKEENWPEWADARPVGKDGSRLWTSPWFGSFAQPEGNNGWILHQDLGWIFVVPIANQGVWFWMDELGWVWTEENVYPFLYSNIRESWLFLHGIQMNGFCFMIMGWTNGLHP